VKFKILLDPRAARSLNKLESGLRDRIKSALKDLEESPENKGESLHPSRYWKIRIGDYRAIFLIERKDNLVIVLFVGHRSKVYDDFGRML
jgi:mRNA interferase RelE/StbE